MNTAVKENHVLLQNQAARERMLSMRREPLFVADWDRVLFIHYEVSAEDLSREIPFELDLWRGRAFVTLVAFSLWELSLSAFGRTARRWVVPFASHEFLNVRTYVRYREEPGIFFLTEWVPSRISRLLARAAFGLPYRYGANNYLHAHERGTISGSVMDHETRLEFRYSGELRETRFDICESGTLDEFLLERYTAFTQLGEKRRFFRIWHAPWNVAPMDVFTHDSALIATVFPWFKNARLVGAHYSAGARGVWMGWPHRLPAQVQARRRHSAFFEM